MAKDVVGNPWIFDTVDTGEGVDSDAASKIFDTIRPYVRRFIFETAAAASTIEVTESSTGRSLTGSHVLDPDSSMQIEFFNYANGIYIKSLTGAGSKVYVYHGDTEEIT